MMFGRSRLYTIYKAAETASTISEQGKAMFLRNVFFNKFSLSPVTILLTLSAQAEPPILTDEFDVFLVTKASVVGEKLGKIEPVFPNDKANTWSLVKPVPGADRRNYLKEGQLDATTVVEIDPDSGHLSLIKEPDQFGVEYYAEVRATNEDGSMDQVLIIIAREEIPRKENSLDMFTQRRSASGLNFYATEGVDPEKVEYAAKIASALLLKDREGDGVVTMNVENAK